MMAAAAVILGYALTLWMTPAANRALVELQYKIRESYAVVLSHPGSFNDLSDGVTFYANKRGANGALQGILIEDTRNPDDPVTTMAATGQVSDEGGQPHLIIFNGRRQELDRATGKLSELSFDQYVLDLDALRAPPGGRIPDTREMTVRQLLHPPAAYLRVRGPIDHFTGELNARIATPLLSLSYALMGLAAILAGAFNRRGMGGRILVAAIAIVVTQALFMTASSMAARSTMWTPLLYAVAVLPAPAGFALANAEWIGSLRLLVFARRRPA
jgi:lipopolysaccharide export system permease protein